MASYASSSSSTNAQSQVSQQEFFTFHNIDRQLFFKLVFQLRRDSSEAMQIMAFWLLLERIHKCQCVITILTYPDPIIESVYEESLMALRVVTRDEYIIHKDDNIPILRNIVGKERISLGYFHEKRNAIIIGVRNIITQVCSRAFRDLIGLVSKYKELSQNQYHQYGESGNNNVGKGTSSSYHPCFTVGDFSIPIDNNPFVFNALKGNVNLNNLNISSGTQESLLNLFSQMQLSENNESQGAVIPPGERTIFLTFSKGYPISEAELKDFLQRSFGDIIETLCMQEVGEYEQPLYARLLVRDAKAMDVVLSERGKVKFAINGKHVWARKYVRRNPNSPPSSPTTGTD